MQKELEDAGQSMEGEVVASSVRPAASVGGANLFFEIDHICFIFISYLFHICFIFVLYLFHICMCCRRRGRSLFKVL